MEQHLAFNLILLQGITISGSPFFAGRISFPIMSSSLKCFTQTTVCLEIIRFSQRIFHIHFFFNSSLEGKVKQVTRPASFLLS